MAYPIKPKDYPPILLRQFTCESVHPQLGKNGKESYYVDLYTKSPVEIQKNSCEKIETGVGVRFPNTYKADIKAPTGLYATRTTLRVVSQCIDSNYAGELQIDVVNTDDEAYEIPGNTKIATLYLEKKREIFEN